MLAELQIHEMVQVMFIIYLSTINVNKLLHYGSTTMTWKEDEFLQLLIIN